MRQTKMKKRSMLMKRRHRSSHEKIKGKVLLHPGLQLPHGEEPYEHDARRHGWQIEAVGGIEILNAQGGDPLIYWTLRWLRTQKEISRKPG